MKTQTTSLPWPVAPTRSAAAVSLPSPAPCAEEAAPVSVKCEGVAGAMRWVGLLAAGQMILFAVIFLFLCAVGQATTPTNPLALRASEYAPTSPRDPFRGQPAGAPSAAEAAPVVAAPVELQLKGILYHATRPAALVNDKVVELNKPVTVRTAHGDVAVRALEITREIVLLEVGGQKLELRLGAAHRATAAPN